MHGGCDRLLRAREGGTQAEGREWVGEATGGAAAGWGDGGMVRDAKCVLTAHGCDGDGL